MQEDDNLTAVAGADEQPATIENPSEAKAAEATPKPEAEKDSAEPRDEQGDAGEGKDDDADAAGDEAGGKRKSGAARSRETIQKLKDHITYLESRSAGNSGEADKAPRLEDFSDFDAFENAKAAFAVRQAIKSERQSVQEEELKSARAEQARELLRSHGERAAEARKHFDDYDKTVTSFDWANNCAQHVADLALESDKSELLQYHFASKPEVLRELNRLSPTAAARRIGQIEARLFYPKPKTETKAPPPVGGLSGGSSPKSTPGQSMSDYERWRSSGS